MKKIEINLDFDGTCVTHRFPELGEEIGAVPVLKRLTDIGHRLILFTMRSDITEVEIPEGSGLHPHPGNFLAQAVGWFIKNDIPLYGIQTNPTQHKWTKSPKSYAPLMIDDSALGCPLIYNPSKSSRKYVDWFKVEIMLEEEGYLPERNRNNEEIESYIRSKGWETLWNDNYWVHREIMKGADLNMCGVDLESAFTIALRK